MRTLPPHALELANQPHLQCHRADVGGDPAALVAIRNNHYGALLVELPSTPDSHHHVYIDAATPTATHTYSHKQLGGGVSPLLAQTTTPVSRSSTHQASTKRKIDILESAHTDDFPDILCDAELAIAIATSPDGWG